MSVKFDIETCNELEWARAKRRGIFVTGWDGDTRACGYFYGGRIYLDHIHHGGKLKSLPNHATKQDIPAYPCTKCGQFETGVLIDATPGGFVYRRHCHHCGHEGDKHATVDEADAAWNEAAIEHVGEPGDLDIADLFRDGPLDD